MQMAAGTRTLCTGFFALVLVALIAKTESYAQQQSGPQGASTATGERELWLIPSADRSVLMHAAVLRPSGSGPFPLVVINHGSTQNADRRLRYAMPDFAELTAWFVRQGYLVVLPQRPGHGETGGPYLENQHGCEHADFLAAGMNTAASIRSTIEYMTSQPFVRRKGVIVVGQSAGGWGALALASENPPMVKAVINFAGGRGGRSYDRANNNCAPDRLVAVAATFGQTARIPTLWIYAENDSYFGPGLSQDMAESYRRGGGRIEFHLLPPFGEDGHKLSSARDGVAVWGPILSSFLSRLR
jgi:dienelactone hydrolase